MNSKQLKKWFQWFNLDTKNEKLSSDHLDNFETKLNQNFPKQTKTIMFYSLRVASVLIIGMVLSVFFTSYFTQDPDFIQYEKTKHYFSTYIEYEIGITKEQLSESNKALITSSLHSIHELQIQNTKLEQSFINQSYDKRILKELIDNFRQQLDILENIETLLNPTTESKQTKLKDYEHFI